MRERDLFIEALQKENPGERAAFLGDACAGDDGLRARVDRLLEEHQRQESFLLDSPPPGLAATMEQSVSERPGTVIGSYKLLEQIGEGGFGVVYMAEQTQPMRRKVALKVLKPGMDTRQVVARFEAERQALAIMDHPNIARVLDGGATASGRPFFVMDLVKGVPITDHCDQNQLTPRERLELFVSVCQAVQHAHQKGIIHRDLKPSNVLVTMHDTKPVVKVIDFGVAKALGQELTDKTLFTGYAQMIGTPMYMSPEQAGQSGLDIDTRSDIYSLGVLLYELLTGTTPFDNERFKQAAYDEIRRIIREEDPPKPSTRLSQLRNGSPHTSHHAGGDSTRGVLSTVQSSLASVAALRQTEPARLRKLLRGELDWIVMKSLEKDRNLRYETANGFAMDIQRYLADEPVRACPPAAWYLLRKFARRNKAALAVGTLISAAVALSVMVLAVSNVVVRQERDKKAQALQDKEVALLNETAALAKAKEQEKRANDNAAKAQTQRQAALDQEQIAVRQELLARRRFYAAQINLANQAWEAGNTARVLDLLESQRPRFDEEDLRTFEWYYLWRLCHLGRRVILRGHGSWVQSLAFSPDGQKLASCGRDNTVRLWDVATSDSQTIFDTGGHTVSDVAFSPTGELLAWTSHDRTARVWDIATRQLRSTLHGHTDLVWSLAFSPDGKSLATASQDKTVRLWDLATGQVLAIFESHEWPVKSVAFSVDGKTLASATTWADSVKVFDVASREVRFTLKAGNPVVFMADGTLACGDRQTGATLWDATTGLKLRELRGTGGHLAVAVTADGRILGAGASDRNVVLWDVPTGQARAHHARLAPIHSIAFSPDGNLVASGADDGIIELWDMAGTSVPTEIDQGAWVNSVEFSRDGKSLIAATGHGIRRWETATGLELESSLARLSRTGCAALSPDGTVLASASGDAIRLLNVQTGQEISTLRGHTDKVSTLAFACDGKSLASTGQMPADGTAKLWDLATGNARVTIVGLGSISTVAFSPDGTSLATAGQGARIQLWNPDTGQQTAVLQHEDLGSHVWIWALTFSPDGKTLAAGGHYGILQLWDVSLGQIRASLKGHTEPIRVLAFSPDGLTLASGTEEGGVKLWDVHTGQERLTLKGHHDWVTSATFAADSLTLATGSADGTVRLWRATADREPTFRKPALNPNDPEDIISLIRRGEALYAASQPKEAKLVCRQALARLEKLPEDFRAEPGRRLEFDLNKLAWNLVADTDFLHDREIGVEFGKRAVVLAKRAVELAPTEENYWDTLGVAHYRAGEYQQGIDTLKKSNHMSLGRLAYNTVFVAMAYQRLGENELAEKWCAAAHHWPEPNADFRARLCAEAAALFDMPSELVYAEQRDDAQFYTRLIEADPEAAWAYFQRGKLHKERGEGDKAATDLAAALRLYTRATEISPKDVSTLCGWAAACAELNEWHRAADVFAMASKCDANNPMLTYWHALTCLGASDRAGYRTACAGTLERLANTQNVSGSDLALWGCALARDAVPDYSPLLQVAEKLATDQPKNFGYLNTLGALLYRAGRISESLQRLNEAQVAYLPADEQHMTIAYNWYLLAMAHHGSGHVEAARQWLDKAVQKVNQGHHERQGTGYGAAVSWNRRLTLELLRREVEELLRVEEKQSAPWLDGQN